MLNQRIILASQSPYRRELLQRLNITFETRAAHLNEQDFHANSPQQLAQLLAVEKAKVVAAQINDFNSIIIGSDQVAVLNGEILHKPETFDKAQQQLTKASNQIMDFYTGLAVISEKKIQQTVEHYQVKLRPLTPEQIEKYLKLDQPFDCAGSFKIESHGIQLFQWLRGDDYTSLIGLPLIQLQSFLLNLTTETH